MVKSWYVLYLVVYSIRVYDSVLENYWVLIFCKFVDFVFYLYVRFIIGSIFFRIGIVVYDKLYVVLINNVLVKGIK